MRRVRGMGWARRTVILTLLASTVIALVISTGVFAAEEIWVASQLNTNSSGDAQPQVFRDRVVWSGQGGSDGGADEEIFTWTPTGGTVQLTANDTSDYSAHVSGDRVVWEGQSGPDETSEVFTWTPAGGTVQLTDNGTDDTSPQVFRDRVVWEGWGGADAGIDLEIFTWTPTGGMVQLTTNDVYEYSPQVSGDRVVWYGQVGADGGDDLEVFTWTPAAGYLQVTSNDLYDWSPVASGDRIAWYAGSSVFDPTDEEIFTWTPTAGILQVTSNAFSDSVPTVSGDRITWSGAGGTDGGDDSEIFTWTPTAGILQLTADDVENGLPQVSGKRVVWSGAGGADGGDDNEIFTWTPSRGTVQLTTDGGEDGQPRVYANRIVWHDEEDSVSKIFTAVPGGPAPFSDVPATNSAYEEITYLAYHGVVKGFSDNSFKPDYGLKRQQFAKMIVLALELPVSEADLCPFTDVQKSEAGSYLDPGDPYYPDHYVAVCAARGLTVGKTASIFAPYDSISRQQLITMVARAASLPDPPLDFEPTFSRGQFSSDEHYVNACKAEYAGFLDGLDGVGPGYAFTTPGTRAEACVLLHAMLLR